MSFEHLLQGTPTARKENKPVSPTFMLGLGGTGKEVLLRLRRMVVERYGSLAALPFIQYAHIDTDTTSNAREQYDSPSSSDPLFDAIRFRPAERIDLTIDGGTGRYVEHSRTYPHIQRWFPSYGKIADLGNLGEGAGQVRVASRLGFYHAPNFQKVTSSLEHARRHLSDPRIANRVGDLGFDFDPLRLDVFIICSIAGGTGGGTFLDVGFLLKRYFENASTVGILMLPSFFTGYAGGTRTQANGYAALMELNHYSFGHSFPANWDGTRYESLPPPPFDVTYLVDGTNEAGFGIPSNGGELDAYQMIAEVLFQDYSLGSFAGKKRATRVNLVNFSQDVYSHNFLNDALRNRGPSSQRNVVGDTFPTRFSSFGFSAIEFPTDRVHSACGARLATEILDHWGNTLLEDPLERLLTRFLSHDDVRFVSGRFERRDGGGAIERNDIEEALLVYDEGSGRTFSSFLWEKAQKIRQLIEAAPSAQKSATLERETLELDRIFSHEDSEDPAEWGTGIRQIESNERRYLEMLKASIEKRARETADDSKHGVAYTLSLLRELKSLLRNQDFRYLTYFESEITHWRDEIQAHSYDLDQIKIDIARHQQQALFRKADLRWDLYQLVGPDDEDPPGSLYSAYHSRVMKQVAKRGKAICEAIDQFLGKDDVTGEGLLASYWKLLSGFGDLRRRLEVKLDYFSKPQSSELSVSLYQETDLEAWYRLWADEGERHKQTLGQIGNQLLQDVFQVETVTAAMALIQRTPSEKLEEKILRHCKEFFTSQEKQPEALELLMDKRWDGERENMIKRAYGHAKVWLRRASTGLDHIQLRPVVADQRPCLIGVDTDNSLRFPELQRIIDEIRSPDDSPPSFQNIGKANRGVILFYNELAGVPAFYPAAITRPGGLQSSYLGSDDKETLHFDKNRFQFGDLIPKTVDEARRYADSVRAFVLARVLGLLKVRNLDEPNSDQVISYYSYSRGGPLDAEDIQLGSEAQSIDALYRDQREDHLSDRRQLLEASEEVIHELRGKNLLWVYWLLLEFYLYLVHPPSRDEKWVSNLTVVQYSPEHAVLAGARDQVRAMLPSKEERKKLENALTARRRGKKGEDMTYEEYLSALAPHVRLAGKYEGKSQGPVVDKRAYLDTPCLDLEKLRGPRKTYPAPRSPRSENPARKTRPCPSCHEPIDVRATYCLHCERHVAEPRTCPICESPVPSDLEECWSCGNQMAQAQKLECPQCRNWSEDDFPCSICGYDPDRPTNGSTSQPSASPPQDPVFGSESAEHQETEPAEASEAVECPTCYSMSNPGPQCSVCGGLL